MWTLDTSIYVRAADPYDEQHADCQALLDALDERAAPILVPRLLLAEVAGVVRRLTRDPIRARLATDALRATPHIQLITLSDTLLDRAAELAGDYAMRGADATFVAVAAAHECTLVSLDREQRERATPIVSVATPQEALATLTRSPPSNNAPAE